MPIYEYYCAECDKEFEFMRSVSKADDPAPCDACGNPAQRQLTTFSFKSDTFTAPRLKRSTQRPLRPQRRGEDAETPKDSPAT